MSYILGISAFYHDSAAALIKNGTIIGAVQEERFTRQKHDASFPTHSVQYLMDLAGIELSEVESIVFYEKPLLKFERLLETYISTAPWSFSSFARAMPIWIKEKLFQKRMLLEGLSDLAPKHIIQNKFLFSEHHLSHAASAYYPSPYNKAVVLTLDGVGEWATTTVAIGIDEKLDIVKELHFPHSLGLLYSAFTYFCGFKVNSGEYKLMGLAPYGEPVYKDLILEKLVDVKEDGSFRLNMHYFCYHSGLKMVGRRFNQLFGIEPRASDDLHIEPIYMDIAASIQAVTEEIVLNLVTAIHREYPYDNLCMAGGVALNCVANGLIKRKGPFKNIWIQPASGDAGGALGAALTCYYQEKGQRRNSDDSDSMQGAYLGPEYSDEEIATALNTLGAQFHYHNQQDTLLDEVSELLSEGCAIGLFQGRMEFGPRALGNRSIIADARCSKTQKDLNLKIKFRESFRPFAPAILEEHVSEWFEYEGSSPYMLMVANVANKHCKKDNAEHLQGVEKVNAVRSSIPAVTHVDYSARIQTVHESTNPVFHKLLTKFKLRTGVPILVNTSFNVRGEPIVCTPEDAYRCFMGTGLDALAIGNYLLVKKEQHSSTQDAYHESIPLD